MDFEEIQVGPGIFVRRAVTRTPEGAAPTPGPAATPATAATPTTAAPVASHGDSPKASPYSGSPGEKDRSGDERWYTDSFQTWGNILDKSAQRFPDREAMVFGPERVTYRQFQERTNLFARGLLRLGVKKGDHVAVWMTNRPEAAYIQFAIYKIGARMVPVNTRFKVSEAEYVIKQSDSVALVMMDRFVGKIDAMAMLKELAPELAGSLPGELRSEKLPRLRTVIVNSTQRYNGCYDFGEVMAMGKDYSERVLAALQASVDPDDVSQIMYTSGTTGFPKGAMIPHRLNVATIGTLTSEAIGLSEQDRFLCVAPFFTNFGTMGNYGLCFINGATLVLHEAFDALEVLKTIEREKITIINGTPSMFISILDHPDFNRYNVSSFRGGLIGGSPVPIEVMKQIRDRLGGRDMIIGYGLVEGSGLTSMTLRGDTVEHMTSTVGRVLPTCQLKIVDPNTGASLPTGEQGEICTHDVYPGCHVMKGYYNKPDATAGAIDPEGWLHSGDLGVLDQEGYLHITGRLKDMFLCGGFNVYPAEVEDYLYTHPKIKQVSVIGAPDHRLGEVCMAYVEPKEGEHLTEQEVIDFCRDKIANVKVPRYVRFISEFPMTAVGKIQKFKLREMAIKELGLEKEAAVKTA